jgi:hypothetical protein
VHFHLCFFFTCFHHGPKLRAAEKSGLYIFDSRAGLRCHFMTFNGLIGFPLCFHHVSNRRDIRSVRLVSTRSTPQWVAVFPGTDFWFFHDQPSDTAPHVPLYHYSASLSFCHTIEFRPLRLRSCLDFVVFSRQNRNSKHKNSASIP